MKALSFRRKNEDPVLRSPKRRLKMKRVIADHSKVPLCSMIGLLLFLPEAHAKYKESISTELKRLMSRHATNKGRKVVVFDFDNTLIFNDTEYAVLDHLLGQRRLLPREDLQRALFPEELVRLYQAPRSPENTRAFLREFFRHYQDRCAKEGKAACYAWLVRLFAGLEPETLAVLVGKVIEEELARSLCRQRLDPKGTIEVRRGLRVYPEQRELVALFHRNGFEVWVVSASHEMLIKTFAPYLGIPPDRVIGGRLKIEDGRYTDELDGAITHEEGKVEAIKKRIRARPLAVFGDSMSDAAMLSYAAELAILIDKGDKDIVDLAKKKGWRIQEAFIDHQAIPLCEQ
jgi:HAD superfamily phosphoserine phosphatase-like hydrolase